MKRDNTAPCHLVWLKRDLRISDHAPLSRAAESGKPVVVLYVYELELIRSQEFATAHLEFQNEALRELEAALAARGGRLVTRVGALPDVFEAVHREIGFTHLWSHEETGNGLTYARDLRVAAWCKFRGVLWTELAQTGVVRRLKSRDGWATRWEQRMHAPVSVPPPRLSAPTALESAGIVPASRFGLPSCRMARQHGGETLAWQTLESFVAVRGAGYRTGMSSPISGETVCSRLSPYLAWGCISIRAVTQRTERAVREWESRLRRGESVNRAWLGSLKSFGARLRWHCHFMQKLEDEPEIEFRNIHSAYNGLRDGTLSTEEGQQRLAAWQAGLTGYPMVDACMRYCQATGWLNFRMRAMLASFAAYHLWLPWRQPALFLARHFLDFEPGIHFAQFQMQSGTTGINTLRIYSPAKQLADQDPHGTFVRRWVPELEGVPDGWLAEPHRMPQSIQQSAACRIGRDYPMPIVDHATAYRKARAALGAVRRTPAAAAEAKRVYARHGSRKQPVRPEFSGAAPRGDFKEKERQGEFQF